MTRAIGCSARSSAKCRAARFEMLAVEAIARWPDFRWRAPQRFTDVAWRLVQERPANLLDPRFRGLGRLARGAREGRGARLAVGLRGSRRLHLGQGQHRRRFIIRSARPCRFCRAFSTCRRMPCPATGPRRACSRRISARPSDSAFRPDGKRRAICTCRAGRAGIRCRRSTGPVTRPGCRAQPTPFLPGQRAIL